MVNLLLVVLVDLLGKERYRVADEQVGNVLGQQVVNVGRPQLGVDLRVVHQLNVVVGGAVVRQVRVDRVVAGLVDPETVVDERLQPALLARPAVDGGRDDVPAAVPVDQVAAVDRGRCAQCKLK